MQMAVVGRCLEQVPQAISTQQQQLEEAEHYPQQHGHWMDSYTGFAGSLRGIHGMLTWDGGVSFSSTVEVSLCLVVGAEQVDTLQPNAELLCMVAAGGLVVCNDGSTSATGNCARGGRGSISGGTGMPTSGATWRTANLGCCNACSCNR